VATLLNVSEKTVYRWINERSLPGYRVSGQYRFSRAEILEWATAERLQVSPTIVQEPESSLLPLPGLTEAFQAGGISYRVGGRDRESVLRQVVETIHLPTEVDRHFVYQVLLARDELLTAMRAAEDHLAPNRLVPAAADPG
jgi:PTS system nitrogen regulatory IIA component